MKSEITDFTKNNKPQNLSNIILNNIKELKMINKTYRLKIMITKNTNYLYILILAIFFTSCGVNKTEITKRNLPKLREDAKSKIQAINYKLNFFKNEEIIESQIIEDSIRIIRKSPVLFIKKETYASTEKIGIPIYGFKKIETKKEENLYILEIKVKHKTEKSNIGFSSEKYNTDFRKYDFILNSTKIDKTNLRELKQDFKNLIKSLKIINSKD